MDCARCHDVVSARLDGEASVAELTAADAHLRGCPSCRRVAERLPLLDRWVRDARSDGGPDLVDAVLARVLGEDTGDDTGDDTGLAPVVGTVVPASVCGCDPHCRCGCQDGRACRCARGAA